MTIEDIKTQWQLRKIRLMPLRRLDRRSQIVDKPIKRRKAKKSTHIDLQIDGVPVRLYIALEKPRGT